MKVYLKSVGHQELKEVSSYEEASRVVREYIKERNLGNSQWMGGSVQEDGKAIARVSYNGVVWPPEPWKEGMKALYVPEYLVYKEPETTRTFKVVSASLGGGSLKVKEASKDYVLGLLGASAKTFLETAVAGDVLATNAHVVICTTPPSAPTG